MLSRRRPSERRALGYEDKQREESNGCRRDPSGHLSRRNWVRQVRAFMWLEFSPDPMVTQTLQLEGVHFSYPRCKSRLFTELNLILGDTGQRFSWALMVRGKLPCCGYVRANFSPRRG